ncbi:MAG: hypothetical protein U1D30_22770 [Planctomycetota bacterium]
MSFAALIGYIVAERRSTATQIAIAREAAAFAEGVERHHKYASNIRHASEALQNGGTQVIVDMLEQCRLLAVDPVHLGIEWQYLSSLVENADHTLVASDKAILDIDFSPIGDLLASGGADERITLWNTRTWVRHRDWSECVGEVNVLEFSKVAPLLAVGGDNGRVIVRRLDDQSILFDEPVVNGRCFLHWHGSKVRVN